MVERHLKERQPWLQGRRWHLLEDPADGVVLLLVFGECSAFDLVMSRRSMEHVLPALVKARTTWVPYDTDRDVIDSTFRLGGWEAVQRMADEMCP